MPNKLCCPKCGNEDLVPQKNKKKTTWMCPHCQTMFRDLDELKKEAKDQIKNAIFNTFSCICSIAFIAVFSYYLILDKNSWRVYIPSDIKVLIQIAICFFVGCAIGEVVTIISLLLKRNKISAEIESLENQFAMQRIVKANQIDTENSDK